MASANRNNEPDMGFLSPLLLLSLFAVLLPLLIHLVRFRKARRLRFSTLAFLHRMAEGAIRRIRLKRRMLLLRMAAIALLAFSLARPVFGPAGSAHEDALQVLLLENGPGMAISDSEGRAMDQAVGAALSILETIPASGRVLVEVTHGAALEWPPLPPAEAAERVRRLEIQNSGNYLDGRLQRLLERTGGEWDSPVIRFITAGSAATVRTASQMDLPDGVERPPGRMLQIVRVGSDPESREPNVSISEWKREALPGGGFRLHVEIANRSTTPVQQIETGLEMDGEMRDLRRLGLEGGESAILQFDWRPGNRAERLARVVLDGDNLLFDNIRYLSAGPAGERSILLLTDPVSAGGLWIRSALEAVSEHRSGIGVDILEAGGPEWEERLHAPDGPSAVVLDGAEAISERQAGLLASWVGDGGYLLILPSGAAEPGRLNRLADHFGFGRVVERVGEPGSARTVGTVAEIGHGHPLFEGLFEEDGEVPPRIDLPALHAYHPLEDPGSPDVRQLFGLEGGGPLMLHREFGEGRAVLSGFGLDPGWSDFPFKPLFAPFLERLASEMTGFTGSLPLEHTLGEPFEAILPARVTDMELMPSGERFVPEQRAVFGGVLVRDPAIGWSPGWLRIRMGERELIIAVNIHTMESDLHTLDDGELALLADGRFGQAEVVAAAHVTAEEPAILRATGSEGALWHLFLLAAILLLLTESLTTRLFKAETNES